MLKVLPNLLFISSLDPYAHLVYTYDYNTCWRYASLKAIPIKCPSDNRKVVKVPLKK
jgi:hypothetical protein